MNPLILNLFSSDEKVNGTIASTLLKYLNNSYALQQLDNPSGNGTKYQDLKGLGEPKWEVNSTPFMEHWGRPQNDGPALRALTSFHLLKQLRQHNMTFEDLLNQIEDGQLPFQNEQELFDKFIYYDLKFVMLYWKQDGFDLWEEVNGIHFFTALVQLKALDEALYFLSLHTETTVEQPSLVQSLQRTFDDLLQFMLTQGNFIDPNKNHIVETPNFHERSGLDIAVILASLYSHNTDNNSTLPFDVTDSGVLNTLYGLMRSMGMIYPINHQRANLKIGVALGRYPEDIYDGIGLSEGNPWFLATSSAAELLYKLIWNLQSNRKDLIIPLNDFNSQFWTIVFDGIAHEELQLHQSHPHDDIQLILPYDSPAFKQTLKLIFDLGESFLDKLREHVSKTGDMSEQFNKYTGFLQGATHLTWSYSSFWNCYHLRNKLIELMKY